MSETEWQGGRIPPGAERWEPDMTCYFPTRVDADERVKDVRKTMPEPTIPWRDGLAEFLPPEKKTQSIIRHVLGEYCGPHPVTLEPTNIIMADADELTEQIMQALTKETP